MAKPFVELVISAPFILVKGFLMGFFSGRGERAAYYFSRRHGIETETLAEHLKEWLGLETTVHLCMEKEMAGPFRAAIAANREKLGMSVLSCRDINTASFELKARLCDRESAERFREQLMNIASDTVSVTVTADREMAVPAWQDVGVGVLTTLPPYQYAIDATVSGPLDDILPHHEQLSGEVLVDVSRIQLQLAQPAESAAS